MHLSHLSTLWTQFRNLIINLWETSETTYSPDTFLLFMRKKLPMFGGIQQQDAQEFIRALLDQLHSELERNKNKNLIIQLFQGIFLNEITCDSCKHQSRKAEPFLDISLSIPQEQVGISSLPLKICHIWDCLSAFIAMEELQDQNMYHCENCKSLQKAKKRMIFDKLPPVK